MYTTCWLIGLRVVFAECLHQSNAHGSDYMLEVIDLKLHNLDQFIVLIAVESKDLHLNILYVGRSVSKPKGTHWSKSRHMRRSIILHDAEIGSHKRNREQNEIETEIINVNIICNLQSKVCIFLFALTLSSSCPPQWIFCRCWR